MSGPEQMLVVFAAVGLAILIDHGITAVRLECQLRDTRRAIADLRAAAAPVDQPAEVDHMACSNPECDAVICCCSKPAECTGCSTLGCQDEGLCWDCRLQCPDCAFEAHSQRAIDLAAGR